MVVLQLSSRIGRLVLLDESRWRHVLEHPEMRNQLENVKEALEDPDEVRKSIRDPSTLLFYRLYEKTPVTKKYLLVIVKTRNEEGFIVTAFFTDRMKKGDAVWKRKP